MIHIVTSKPQKASDSPRRLPFYLAVEEWVARRLPMADYFFTWRVAPTVIFGRNQDVRAEVNLEYCRDHGIEIYRRRSGGGCVFADMSNIMISCISPRTEVNATFAQFTHGIAEMLCQLGLNAEATGRNDVLVNGHKVSGNAFYHLPTRSIMHGTLLFDTDFAHMANAITPSRSKLESHKVASVEHRITTLSPLLPDFDILALQQHIISYFTDQEYCLTLADLDEIAEIEAKYYDLNWIFGRTGPLADYAHAAKISRRIPGVGTINLNVRVDDDRIESVEMTGDFFMYCDLDSAIFDKIKGRSLNSEDLSDALADTDVSRVIEGLSNETLIDLLTSARIPVLHSNIIKSQIVNSKS